MNQIGCLETGKVVSIVPDWLSQDSNMRLYGKDCTNSSCFFEKWSLGLPHARDIVPTPLPRGTSRPAGAPFPPQPPAPKTVQKPSPPPIELNTMARRIVYGNTDNNSISKLRKSASDKQEAARKALNQVRSQNIDSQNWGQSNNVIYDVHPERQVHLELPSVSSSMDSQSAHTSTNPPILMNSREPVVFPLNLAGSVVVPISHAHNVPPAQVQSGPALVQFGPIFNAVAVKSSNNAGAEQPQNRGTIPIQKNECSAQSECSVHKPGVRFSAGNPNTQAGTGSSNSNSNSSNSSIPNRSVGLPPPKSNQCHIISGAQKLYQTDKTFTAAIVIESENQTPSHEIEPQHQAQRLKQNPVDLTQA